MPQVHQYFEWPDLIWRWQLCSLTMSSFLGTDGHRLWGVCIFGKHHVLLEDGHQLQLLAHAVICDLDVWTLAQILLE